MKKIKYLIVAFGLVFMTACEDSLNVEPTLSISDEAALGSAASIKKLLIGIYEIDGNRDSHGGYVQIYSDLLGFSNEVSWNGTFPEPREALTKNLFVNNFFVGEMWNNLYRVINQSNLVISRLEVFTDEEEKAVVEGEAKFMRALSYFELVRLYGTETVGVPLRTDAITDFGADLSIERSPTTAIYDFIKADLASAIALLPEENSFYASKYAALALKARVELYLGNYAEALAASNDVITNSGKALSPTFADAFNHDEDGEEDIFAMQVTSQTGENYLIQHYASEGNGGRGGDISINDAYLNLFDDENDERATFYYENEESDFLTSKYTNQFGNIALFRLAEMYLIRAESNSRLGSQVGDSPLNDINAIRKRSGASALSSVTLAIILTERKRELAFEGLGIYDVKRTKASVGSFPYNDPKLVLPIPQDELDTNKSIDQNPGY